MIDLQECRNEIDKIDSDIIRLFEQRMKVCEDVAEYKIRTGKKVLDPERERQKLEVLRGKAHGEFNQLGAQELFQQIMAGNALILSGVWIEVSGLQSAQFSESHFCNPYLQTLP